MIQSNDLRLGNVVLDTDGRYNSVVEIKHYFVVLNRSKSMDERYIPLESLRPVPLTEEVLLKCGFFKDNIGRLVNELYEIAELGNSEWLLVELTRQDGDGYNIMIHSKGIEYLHQLQNLIYALTGKELEVNL